MSNNLYYIEIIKQITEINNNKFEIKQLRKAIEITNKAKFYFNKDKISKEELNDIYKNLKNIIKIKLLELNPNLSIKVLNKICKCCDREYSSLPQDISVINNQIIFYQEDNLGNPYDTNIYLLSDNSKKDFKDLNKITINNEDLPITEKIISIINEILKWYFPSDKPLIFIEDNKIVSNSYIKVFTNNNLTNINNQKNITIKLLVLGDWNEFYLLEINLKTFKNTIISFNWEKLDTNIWNLKETEEKKNTLSRTKHPSKK